MTSENTTTILVVDDNEMNRDVLSRRLERQGFHVVMAEDGVLALEALQQQMFDLVLLDIMMPRMNGYEVLETLKNDPARRSIPVIVISAMDDLESVVKCIELGADDYLFKPFNPVLLRARIHASLSKRQNTHLTEIVSALNAHVSRLAAEEDGTLTDQQRATVGEIANLLARLQA